jgi:hypothetical protein
MDPIPRTDEPAQGTVWSKRTGRRTFLKGAAMAGAATLAVPLLGRTSARASTNIVYGANYDFYTRWTGYVSGNNGPNPPPPGTSLASPDGKNCERRYFDGIVPFDDNGDETGPYTKLVPDWTTMACHTNYAIVSLRINPIYLLESPQRQIPDNGSGYTTLDGQINHLISTMPAHSVLTNWQEAGPGNTLNFPSYCTQSNISRLHNHMQALFNASSTQANYGQIVIDNPADIGPWLGQNLDCYMVDIYDYSDTLASTVECPYPLKVGQPGTGTFRNADGTLSQSKINTRMTNYLTAFKGATTATAPIIHISETNSPVDGHRKNWFLYLTEWMNSHGGYRICSHWHKCGKDSGDWPTDTSLLDYFVYLQYTYGA